MKVTLLHHTPLWVCSKSIRKCWASEDKSDTVFLRVDTDRDGMVEVDECSFEESNDFQMGEADEALIERVGIKNKHASTLEHLVYNFDIDGISRACLQELARHRIASLSVQSSRYTLEKVIDKVSNIRETLVQTGDEDIDNLNEKHMIELTELIKKRGKSLPRDISKYALPESFKTSLAWTVNARSLQNFLSLRSDKAALWEIRSLAWEVYNALPEDHQYLFNNFMKEYE